MFHVKHNTASFTPEDFRSLANVSCETIEKLHVYSDLLHKWHASINLVGSRTITEIWHRHFYDSAQIYPYLEPNGLVIDLGSGAGFPGLVLAVMGHQNVTLIESNGKKCAFLRDVCQRLSLDVIVCQSRIENCRTLPRAKYVVSRALAPLEKLLSFAYPLLGLGGVCVFLKGATVETELTAARKHWIMNCTAIPSHTSPEGVILTVGGLEPKDDRLESE